MNARRLMRTILGIAGAAVLSSCAAYRIAPEELAFTEAAIADARTAGAREHAPAELALAQEKLALSRRFIAASDIQPGLWLVQQAHVDAELAKMKAMSARSLRVASLAAEEMRARNVRIAQAGGGS